MERGKSKTRIGTVTSDKMDKTVVVEVPHIIMHPLYKKHLKKSSSFKVHDEENKCRVGDKVLIVETRPYSKTKRWRVREIIEQAVVVEDELLEEFSLAEPPQQEQGESLDDTVDNIS